MKKPAKVICVAAVLAAISFGVIAASAQAPGVTSAGGSGARPPGLLPNATDDQSRALGAMNFATLSLIQAASAAHAELLTATFAEKKDGAAIRAKADALSQVELRLAILRAEEFARLQAGPNKLTPEQVQVVVVFSSVLRNVSVQRESGAGPQAAGQ